MDMDFEQKNGFFMKRSISTCLIVCGVLFFVEFGVEQAVQPDSSLSHLVGVMSAQIGGVEEKPEDPRPERKLQNPSQEWFLQLEKITAAVEEEDYERAREMLDRQVERTRRWNDFELAIFHRRYMDLGLLLEDYDLVLEHAKKILEYRESIQYYVEENTLYMVARIYASENYEDYETSLEYLQRWLDLTNDWDEGATNYAFIANVYNNLENYYKTEEWWIRAIDKSEEEGNAIPPYWWIQLWQTYRQLSDQLVDIPAERDLYLEKALDLSKYLVLNFIEEKEHWRRLSSDYAKTDEVSGISDEEGGQGYYTIEAAYHFGLWETETEYKKVISSMQIKEANSRAALVFEEGFDLEIIERNFDNLKRYGQTLYLTTDLDKAIRIYEEAVGYKDDAEVLHTLASLHQLMDNFDECILFADRALNATEGELGEGDPENVKFIKGVCQFYKDDLDGSENTMNELREEIGTEPENATLENYRESAGQYIKLIEAERARNEYKNHVENSWRVYLESKQG